MLIAEIHVDPGRRRKLNPEKVQALAASIAEIGLLNPITVTPDHKLVAGYHRLDAFRSLGRAEIPHIEVPLNALEAELAEIDENLVRNNLTDLQEGELLERREEILAARGQRAPAHRPEKGDTVSPLKTTAQIASEAGISERGAQRRKQAARDIVPEAKDLIRETPVADCITQLVDLSKKEPDKQVAIAEKIASGQADDVRSAEEQILEAEFMENAFARVEAAMDAPQTDTPLRQILTSEQRRDADAVLRGIAEEEERLPAATLASGMFGAIRALGTAPLSAQDFVSCLRGSIPRMLQDARSFLPAALTLLREIEREVR